MTLLSLALLACTGPDDTAGTEDTSDTQDTEDTGVERVGWTLSGVGLDYMTQTTTPTAGKCVTIVNPELALVTGDSTDLEVLGQTVIDDEGAWTVDGIITDTQVGMFLMATDCADEGTSIPTGTGIAYADYQDVEDGTEIAGLRAVFISTTMASAAINPSFIGIGRADTDIAVEGMMMGFVEDSAGVPVAGATVAGEDEAFVAYLDPDPNGGLFANDGVPNTATLAEGGGWFMSPGAPITTYTATHDTLTFEPKLFGTLPGLVTVFKFTAN